MCYFQKNYSKSKFNYVKGFKLGDDEMIFSSPKEIFRHLGHIYVYIIL